MEFLNNFLTNIAQSPEEYYHDYNQATVNSKWLDTTQLRLIKEQNVSLDPFTWGDDYVEFEGWVDTISDMLVNVNKVYSDFIEILPKDIDHRQNYRGQYYKVSNKKRDAYPNELYMCYDTINDLEQLPIFKCVRCNNTLTFTNKDNKIVHYPCYLGTDISSTNDYVAKSGIVPNVRMIIMVQKNEDTKNIVNNQRFMFEHESTFEVEEINNFMQEEGTDGAVTFIKIYVKYSTILPRDNKELNLCDYYGSEDRPQEDPIVIKHLEVSPANCNIKQGKSKDITYKVVDADGTIIDQTVTFSVDWENSDYYTLEPIVGGVRIENIKMCSKPLNITFSSDGCEDVVSKLYLVNKF